MSSVTFTVNIGLGECHEFDLSDGTTRALKLLRFQPLRWQTDDGLEIDGDLNVALGQMFTGWRKLATGW